MRWKNASVRSNYKRKTYPVAYHTYEVWFKLRGYEELAKIKGENQNQQTHSDT